MRAAGDFGRLRAGMRADIVLLERDPLDDLAAYKQRAGVMVRGRWLTRARLDAALEELARLYVRAAAAPIRPTPTQVAALEQRARRAVTQGFVFNARIVAEAADAFRHAGAPAAGDRLAGLAVAPTTGPCFAVRW
jgi:N-acyl-D-aspartate/D-glutamate deacylase